MSSQIVSLAFIAPGHEMCPEDEFSGWFWLVYEESPIGDKVLAEAFCEWIQERGFAPNVNCWWSRTAAMGLYFQSNPFGPNAGQFVAAVNATFDCEQNQQIENWLAICDQLLELGFRVVKNEDANREDIRTLIETSEAWQFRARARIQS